MSIMEISLQEGSLGSSRAAVFSPLPHFPPPGDLFAG